MPENSLPKPWLPFLQEIDGFVSEETSFHCMGGFVMTRQYGSPRSTSDIDFLTVVGNHDGLIEQAGEGSNLHAKYGVYLDSVGVAITPEDYEDRLTEMYPGIFRKIRLWALDPYDLILTKLDRNILVDREDVEYLAEAIPLDLDLLRKRYKDEFRVYVRNERREDQTLDLWIEMIEENRERKKSLKI